MSAFEICAKMALRLYQVMTHTLTLELPEQIYKSLAERAAAEGRRVEDVALEKLTNGGPGPEFEDPLEKFIGAFTSDVPDWADKHDKYLGENLYRELRGENE